MDLNRPKFMDSEFFVAEPGNWRLLPGAPQYIQEEFAKYMEALNEGGNEDIELVEILDDADE